MEFVLLSLAGKRTSLPITLAGLDNCSSLITELILAALYFSDLAVAVTKPELTSVDLFLSPALLSFAVILSGLEIHLDFVVLDNLFHSSAE